MPSKKQALAFLAGQTGGKGYVSKYKEQKQKDGQKQSSKSKDSKKASELFVTGDERGAWVRSKGKGRSGAKKTALGSSGSGSSVRDDDEGHPETMQPQTTPETTQSKTTQPEIKQPQKKQPEIKQPPKTQPSTNQSQTPQPPTKPARIRQPPTTQPETTHPGNDGKGKDHALDDRRGPADVVFGDRRGGGSDTKQTMYV